MKPSSATDGEKIAVRRQLLADSIHVIRCLVDQCDECHAIAQRYAPDGVYATLEWVTTESSTLIEDAPCETCNDDPAVCATVPGLRHCEAAMRETRVSEIEKPQEVLIIDDGHIGGAFGALLVEAEASRSARAWNDDAMKLLRDINEARDARLPQELWNRVTAITGGSK